jgi:fucose permease
MKYISPVRLLIVTGLLALLGVLVILFSNTLILALAGVLLVGFGFANVFPLIFSITIDNMPGHQNELSGLMVTMIVGGTFVPMIMGTIADATTITFAFIVPLVCISYVIFLGIMNYKKVETKYEK